MWERSWALVAHACNPSYLGGWEWEDHVSRPSQSNSFGVWTAKEQLPFEFVIFF
jgi:hypothetical protein